MRFEHLTDGHFELSGGGVVGSVGVGLPGITISGSTYDMFSRNIGNVFASPTLRSQLRPRNFAGFLNIVEAGCAAGFGYGLTLFVFSAVPLTLGPVAWMTVRAVTAGHGLSIASTAGCSITGKVYYMSLR